jgi:pyridoxine kinase
VVLSIQSHVCYGAAGNSAAVFPMRRLGVECWPVNTVQYSNHTQYGRWEGAPAPDDLISALARGIEAIGALGRCNAVLSGYLGSEEQGSHVLDVVRRVKAANPAAIYLCDPVMGHAAKGCVVPVGVQQHHAQLSAAHADVLCPNVLELGIMTGTQPRSCAEVAAAAQALMAKGSATLCLVKHLAHAGLAPHAAFEMLLVEKGCGSPWHVSTPLLPFTRPPVGVGDLTSALFLVGLLKGHTPRQALEHTAAAYFEVMRVTSQFDEFAAAFKRLFVFRVTRAVGTSCSWWRLRTAWSPPRAGSRRALCRAADITEAVECEGR